MGFKINKILHASFLVEDTVRSLEFYHDLLGLEIDASRPDLGYPGAWLTIGDQQLHLIQLPNPDSKQRPDHGGHDRHVALQVMAVNDLRKKIETENIEFTTSKSRPNVMFIRDPDGNTLELIGD